MKKFLIFALLALPMTAFAASSVRVLGATPNTGTKTTTSSATKLTPAKATAAKTTSTSTTPSSRVGTMRVVPKAPAGTASTTSAGASAGSRFPVIAPVKAYKTVNTQQAGSNTGSSNSGSVSPTPAGVTDDPRFDMIHVDSRESYWRTNYPALTNQRENEGYVFMWVEE